MTAQPVAAAAPAAAERSGAWAPPDARRWLQLGLAALWVLDGVLQYQSFMFTKAFSQMLAGSASGNPAFVADSVRWAAGVIAHSPAITNAAFATIQLALGLGIAWRPAVRVALAASVAWSVAVWWFGEGLGGVLTGGASPVNGAPGAVVLYALLAVLIWPAASPRPQAARGLTGPGSTGARSGAVRSGAVSPGTVNLGQGGSFVAARPLGVAAARGVWVVLWGSLAYFSLTGASRTAQGLHDMIAGMADREPGWLASVDRGAAGALARHGLPASIALAVILAAIAAGIFLPAPGARVAVALSVAVSVVIWVVGQDLGEILAGNATDVNSGPLLVLIALAYWPLRARTGPPGRPRPAAGSAVTAEPAGFAVTAVLPWSAVTAVPAGFAVSREYSKVGWRASDTRGLSFASCRVPAGNLLGERGRGYAQFLAILDEGRVALAALAAGLAQGCVDECLRYVADRSAFGHQLGHYQAIQFKIADMEARAHLSRLAWYDAAARLVAGQPFKKEAAIAKLTASAAAMDNARDATQVFGGYGFMNEYPVARFYRDAKVLEIGEGTSEVQRMIIARQLGLGK